jgi:hypothetical protein
MSGKEETKTIPTFGPRQLTRLDLMGVRFANDNEGGDGGAGGGAGGNEYKAPETQADLDRIITARLERERDKFKDYDDLKSKAGELERLRSQRQQPAGQQGSSDDVTRQLTEFGDRVTAAEKTASETQTQLTETQVELARKDVALDKGITKDQLPLLTATSREELEKQADAILKIAGAAKASSGRVPGQGGRENGAGSSSVSAGRDLFANSRKKTSTS